jgi:hypothetical protein
MAKSGKEIILVFIGKSLNRLIGIPESRRFRVFGFAGCLSASFQRVIYIDSVRSPVIPKAEIFLIAVYKPVYVRYQVTLLFLLKIHSRGDIGNPLSTIGRISIQAIFLGGWRMAKWLLQNGEWFKPVKSDEELNTLLGQKKESRMQRAVIWEGDFDNDISQIEVRILLKNGMVLYGVMDDRFNRSDYLSLYKKYGSCPRKRNKTAFDMPLGLNIL